jgi:hypothetical protein
MTDRTIARQAERLTSAGHTGADEVRPLRPEDLPPVAAGQADDLMTGQYL